MKRYGPIRWGRSRLHQREERRNAYSVQSFRAQPGGVVVLHHKEGRGCDRMRITGKNIILMAWENGVTTQRRMCMRERSTYTIFLYSRGLNRSMAMPNIILHRVRCLLVCCITAFLLCACQTKIEDADVRWVPGLAGKKLNNVDHVSGIRQALSDSKTPVRVLFVHGMITKDPHYSETFQASVAKKLDLSLRVEHPVKSLERGYQFTVMSGPQPFGTSTVASELRKTSWSDDSNRDRLVVYELLWAPLRDDLKRQFIACYESRLTEGCKNVTEINRATDSRTSFNGWLKDDIMVNGFADAMLVLGPLGDVLRDDVNQAMCIIASDALMESGIQSSGKEGRCDLLDLTPNQESRQQAGATLQNTRLITITHSLGSFLVLDTQQQYARTSLQLETLKRAAETRDEQRDNLLFVLTDQSTVYMMANQIGLLQLARLGAVCHSTTDKPSCPNRLLPPSSTVLEGDARAQLRRFVAFNDSNDLLGFELQPYLSEMSMFGILINVSVNNPGFSIPWLFKNPQSAHTGHFENDAIIG